MSSQFKDSNCLQTWRPRSPCIVFGASVNETIFASKILFPECGHQQNAPKIIFLIFFAKVRISYRWISFGKYFFFFDTTSGNIFTLMKWAWIRYHWNVIKDVRMRWCYTGNSFRFHDFLHATWKSEFSTWPKWSLPIRRGGGYRTFERSWDWS